MDAIKRSRKQTADYIREVRRRPWPLEMRKQTIAAMLEIQRQFENRHAKGER